MGSSFAPNMQSHIQGVTVLGDLHWRAWDGVVADVWEVEFEEGARGEYISPDPRLVITLDRDGSGDMLLRTDINGEPVRESEAGTANYVPAGMRLWSSVTDLRGMRHLDIHFDMETLRARFGDRLDESRVNTPRLMFHDDRVLSIARLIAAECISRERGNDLFGDGLIAALVAALWGADAPAGPKRGKLTKMQVKHLTEFIEANCLRSIRLQELADLTGLSPGYVGRAFKASTGLALHTFQMKARIDRVKLLLRDRNISLTETADMTGFADQAHLTRVFRRIVGTTPAAWQRAQSLSIVQN